MERGPWTIRPAELSDAQAMARVHIQSWQATYSGMLPASYLDNLLETEGPRRLAQWKSLLSQPATSRLVWVAELASQVVGFASAGQTEDRDRPNEAEIYTLYLLKSCQGLGIGRALFEKAISEIQRRGLGRIGLWVAKGNPTEGFYRHLGGQPDREKSEETGGVPLVEVRYLF